MKGAALRSWLWRQRSAIGVALLVALALFTRFWSIGERPVSHDESLFSYYAFIFSERGAYIHEPLLHGPVLMLVVGSLFGMFGDSMELARGFIAVCSLVALAASLLLVPRATRGWLALLLFTSPVLVYVSRFMRNEMLFVAVLMLGMAGVVRALSRVRARPGWAALGAGCAIGLIAIKENALFVYASAATFGVAWALARAVAARTRPASGEEGARPTFGRAPGRRVAAGWLAGLVAGSAIVVVAYGTTLAPEHRRAAVAAVVGPDDTRVAAVMTGRAPLAWHESVRVQGELLGRFWINLRASWDYWLGQHSEQRVFGALHHYIPVLLTYELPLLLLLAMGFLLDGARARPAALAYAGGFAGWLVVWLSWRGVAHPEPPGWLASVSSLLHVAPDPSSFWVGAMMVPLLVWSLRSLCEGRILAAWLGWWAACSFFQYASAGEKVPWLAAHIVLPLYLVLPWLWEPKLAEIRSRSGRGGVRARALVAALILVSACTSLLASSRLIGDGAADPRERMVYNYTSDWIDEFMKERVAAFEAASDEVPLRERKVVLAGAPAWPGIWYFRHCRYLLTPPDRPLSESERDADLVIAEASLGAELLEAEPERWVVTDGSLRNHWWAPWPYEEIWWRGEEVEPLGLVGSLQLLRASAVALWRYYWLRETWTEPGGFPVVALEPRY